MGPDQDNKETPVEPSTPVPEQPVVVPEVTQTAPVVPAVDVESETPAVAVAPAAQAVPTTAPVVLPVKKSKKGLLIALISVGAVLLLGGTAAGLAVWWTSPNKAFDDAMSLNTSLTSTGAVKGAMVVVPKSGPEVTVEFTAKADGMKTNTDLAFKVNAGAINVNLTGSFATDDSKNVYVKVNDVKKTVDSFAGENAALIDDYYGKLISKIDGKWVEVTTADMKDLTSGSEADGSCVVDTLSKASSDSSYVKELASMYSSNKYLTFDKLLGSETINGKDSHHILVAVDKTKLDSFSKAILKSKLFTELEKCGAKTTDTTDTTATTDLPKVEVWVDKWSHKVTKMTMSQTQDGTSVNFSLLPDYTKQTVTVPKADTQFKDLKSDVEALQQQFSATEEQQLSDYSY